MSGPPQCEHRYRLRLRWTEFPLPPVRDGVVLGKQAPVGPVAMRKALEFLSPQTYSQIDLEDDVIAAILIRESIIRRISRDVLVRLILDRLKPFMAGDEVLRLDVEHEVYMEEHGP